MEPITSLISAAIGYILKGAANSKAADTVKEQALDTFWRWIRPKFIKAVPEIEKTPESPETVSKTRLHLIELLKDASFLQELQQQIDLVQQAHITEKNIVKKDIIAVGKVHIGDKIGEPGETWNHKNIVEGNVINAAEFTLGDGH